MTTTNQLSLTEKVDELTTPARVYAILIERAEQARRDAAVAAPAAPAVDRMGAAEPGSQAAESEVNRDLRV